MKIAILVSALVALAVATPLEQSPEIKFIEKGISGEGTTTRYWDCCKPSCSWRGNVHTPSGVPVASCDRSGVNRVDANAKSGCEGGGSAYMCNSQQPWAVNSTLAYGFGAASFSNGVDVSLCCACFLLSFKDQISNKKMIVQVTNTGSDLSHNHFDIALPGGGVGIFTQGCHDQWNAPWNGWGDQYGGVHNRGECATLPQALQSGCYFRFDFYQNANNPRMHFDQVQCPAEIVARSGCSL
ncbi:endoglucanase [Diabrotica virgifera virgifera]|uniref:Cellulase n=1 Tax=Diabrotica virgifera virgifera TaxID=50390 RepID=I1VZE8_DIAVI|nr:endoglucanase [Diabrotica virgifera virgifera]AFI56547.1 endogenous endoglucanase [Diabrotica virgifera virgifera]